MSRKKSSVVNTVKEKYYEKVKADNFLASTALEEQGCSCFAHCWCECVCGAWADTLDDSCFDCGANGGWDHWDDEERDDDEED